MRTHLTKQEDGSYLCRVKSYLPKGNKSGEKDYLTLYGWEEAQEKREFHWLVNIPAEAVEDAIALAAQHCCTIANSPNKASSTYSLGDLSPGGEYPVDFAEVMTPKERVGKKLSDSEKRQLYPKLNQVESETDPKERAKIAKAVCKSLQEKGIWDRMDDSDRGFLEKASGK